MCLIKGSVIQVRQSHEISFMEKGFFFFSLKFLFETFEEIPPRVRGIPHFHTDWTQSCYCRIKEATSILSAWRTLLYPWFWRSVGITLFLSWGVFHGGEENQNIYTYINFILLLHFCNKSFEKKYNISMLQDSYIQIFALGKKKSEFGKCNSIFVAKVLGGCFISVVNAVYPALWCQSLIMLCEEFSLLSISQDHSVYQCLKFKRNRNTYV